MTIEELPDELLVQILECVPDAYKLNVVSKLFKAIVDDIEQRVFKNPNRYIEELSPPVYFLLKDNKYHKAIWGKAVIKGHLDLVIKLDKLGYKFNVDMSMASAAQGGYENSLKVVEFFIEKGADNWDWGMQEAAKTGNKDLVNFFIKKGAKDWNTAMASAAQQGHKDLVNFFIEKGACWWNWGMIHAAQGGRKDLVEIFIEKGANDWNSGMICAVQGGHEDLVEFFIEKGANNRNWTMQYAAI